MSTEKLIEGQEDTSINQVERKASVSIFSRQKSSIEINAKADVKSKHHTLPYPARLKL